MNLRKISLKKDSYFGQILNIEDDDEILYSKCNINYVFYLFNPSFKPVKNVKASSSNLNLKSRLYLKLTHFLNRYIYKWDDNFRFTSRFLNTMVVASVNLYYFFLFWYFWILKRVSVIEFETIDTHRLFCDISDQMCLNESKIIDKTFKGLDHFIKETLESDYEKEAMLARSIKTVAVLPVFISFLICAIQLFLIAKDCKTHLLELYRGDCDFIKKAKHFENSKIAGSSFHFGGFLIGYLIWVKKFN